MALSHNWCILKLGTGTACAIISNLRLREGLMEVGKLGNNIFCSNESSLEVGYHKTPDGGVNEIVSAKLLPRVFQELTGCSTFSSYEIGRMAQFFFDNPNCYQIQPATMLTGITRILILDIGIDQLYTKHLGHLMSKAEFENLIFANNHPNAYKLKRSVLSVLKLDAFSKVQEQCLSLGAERILDLLFEITRSRKGNTAQFNGSLLLGTYEQTLQGFLTDQNSCEITVKFFEDIFKRAGALLADVLALIRLYYDIDGIIFSGGVLANTSSSSRLIASVEKHIKAKYDIHLATLDEYQQDDKTKLIGKRSFTSLYTNLNKDGGKWQVQTNDRGEIGCLYNAAIKHVMPYYKPETNVAVDSDEKIQGFWPSEQFCKYDYKVVEVVALVSNIDGNVALFRRNQGFEQAGQLLFQSGKVQDEDCRPIMCHSEGKQDCKDCSKCVKQKLKREVILKAVKRELDEEIKLVVAEQDICVREKPFPQAAKVRNSKNGFMFYLAKVNVEPNEIQEQNLDSAFAGEPEWYSLSQIRLGAKLNSQKETVFVASNNGTREINADADAVFVEMFRWLKQLDNNGKLHTCPE